MCVRGYGRCLRENPIDGTGGRCRSDPCSLSQFGPSFLRRKELSLALCHLELGLNKQFEFRIVYFEEGYYTQFLHFRFTKSLTWKTNVTQIPNKLGTKSKITPNIYSNFHYHKGSNFVLLIRQEEICISY